MKTKKISVTFLIALMFIATFFVISFSPTVSASTASLQNIDDVCAQMTQSETNGGINLKDYVEDFAERIQYQREIPMAAFAFQYDAEIESSLFANNTTYSLYNDSNACATVEMIITGDNNITKFIPRQLFTQPCEKLYIGSEYGFYISTVEADGITKSTVLNYDWIHPYLQGATTTSSIILQKMEMLKMANVDVVAKIMEKRAMEKLEVCSYEK